MEFSLKQKGAILWKSGFSLDQVKEKFPSQAYYDDWQICPLGEAGKAVSIGEFMADPEMWERDNPYRTSEAKINLNLSQGEQMILKKLGVIQGWVVFIGIVAILFLGVIMLGMCSAMARY